MRSFAAFALLIAMMCPFTIALAADGQWIAYTTKNSGLVSDTISTVVFDDKGIAWIGYRDRKGITCFDGVSWRTFTAADGLPDGMTEDITIHDGLVWAVIGGQVCKYNNTYWEIPFQKFYSFDRIAFDNNGTLWTSGTDHRWARIIARFDGSSWTTWLFSYPNQMFFDHSNRLWCTVGWDSQWIYRYDGAIWERLPSEQFPSVTSMTLDKNQVMWMTTGNGVARYNGEFLEYLNGVYGIYMAVDRNNRKWFACFDYILVYDEREGSVGRADIPWQDRNYDLNRIAVGLNGSVFAYSAYESTGLVQYIPGEELKSVKRATFTPVSIPKRLEFAGKHAEETGDWLFPIHSFDTWVYRHISQTDRDAPVHTDRLIITVISTSPDTLEFLDGRRFPVGYSAYYSAHPHFFGDGRGSFPSPSPDGSSGIYRWELATITVPAGSFPGFELFEAEFAGRYYCFIPGVGWAKSGLNDCLGWYDSLQLEYARIGDREYGVKSPVQSESRPAALRVYPPSPNPFNPSTTIRFDLGSREHVRLTIYTATGQKVADLCDAILSPGSHAFTWKPEHCASGLYLYLIRTGSDVKAGKMMLVR